VLAAAAAVVAVFGWLREPRSAGAGDPSQTYLALRSAVGTVNPRFQATEHAPGASGDVVWSQSGQQGVLHLIGLPANDPRVEQYQLWIIDAEQKQPIDGGVFDVAGGEGWIAIDPKLAVARPTAFAVTLEKPGGVVVSAQDRVVLVAAL
jgi:anti-sigma-K factor RskA